MALAVNSDRFTDLEKEIDRLRQELAIPGLSMAVVRSQEVVFARGWGHADLERQIPAAPDTPYQIDSLTKPFAAAVLMKLVEQGRLSLDDRIADLLHDVVFALGPRGQVSRGYHSYCQRLRELSEDPSLPFAFMFQDYRGDREPVTVRHHVTHTAQGVPGTTYRYNGFLFGMLASVLEKVSGQPFRDLMVEHITSPLGMTDTVPGASETQAQQVLARQAKYYRTRAGGFEPSGWPPPEWIEAMERCGLDPTPSLNAGAGMISNVLDLAKFDAAMDRDAIVSAKTKALMFAPARSNSGERLPYGLGWFIQDSDHYRLVWHYGNAPGAHSSLLFKVPAASHTLILLANSDAVSRPFDLDKGNVLDSPFARLFLHWLP